MYQKSLDDYVLLYIADPMCSWCWGFSPVIDAIEQRYGDRVRLELIAGGLFPNTSTAMDDRFKAMVREHWQHVAEQTGQPFDFGFFERQSFVYDTEPACRALVAARELSAQVPLAFLKALHAAFYRDNRDITQSAVIGDVAQECGFDRERFLAELESEESWARTIDDFALARELGMRGLPTLLSYDRRTVAVVAEGYQPLAKIVPRLEHCLDLVTPA